MLDWTTCQAVECDPGKLSGAWVFRGSRVPVSALFENLESGATLDQFLTWFPGVTRAQAEAVLQHTTRTALQKLAGIASGPADLSARYKVALLPPD